MAASALRPLSIGEVLDVSFGLYRSNFGALLTVALITQAAPLALSVYMNASPVELANAGPRVGVLLGYLFLAIVLGSIGTGASTFVVSDSYLGGETSATAALGRAMPLVGRLIGVSLMMGLLAGLGMVVAGVAGAILIPLASVVGVIAAIAGIVVIIAGITAACIIVAGLALSIVAAVVESPIPAGQALGRAWNLSRGFRGKVFVTLLTGFLLLVIPSAAMGVVAGVVGPSAIALGVIQAILQVMAYPFLYVLYTVLYYDLRVRKEGFDLELLASTLQPA